MEAWDGSPNPPIRRSGSRTYGNVREGNMRSWQWPILCLACLAAAGCRVNPSVALLERENLELEDRVYQLADLLEDCRRENARLRRKLEPADRETWQPEDQRPRPAAPEPAPERETIDSLDLAPPAVEIPGLDVPGQEALERPPRPETPPPPDEQPPPWIPPSEDDNRDAAAVTIPPRVDNANVQFITLNDRLTGGYDKDGRVGHEGVTAVLEPRGARGRTLNAAAPVSVVLLDPLLPGDAARVARWDFTAEEIAASYRKTPLSEGIHLELVWPSALPIHSQLQMFVRYTTDDGRKLEAEKRIEVDVPVLQARRPTPAPRNQPTAEASPPARPWQGKPPPLVEPGPTGAVQTPLVPDGPHEPAGSAPRANAPKRPVWSPDRE